MVTDTALMAAVSARNTPSPNVTKRIIDWDVDAGLRGCVSGLRGCVSVLRGCVSVLRGCVSGLRGCVSGLRGCVSGFITGVTVGLGRKRKICMDPYSDGPTDLLD